MQDMMSEMKHEMAKDMQALQDEMTKNINALQNKNDKLQEELNEITDVVKTLNQPENVILINYHIP